MLFLKALIPTRKLTVGELVQQGADYHQGQDCVIGHVELVVLDATVFLLVLLATLRLALAMPV